MASLRSVLHLQISDRLKALLDGFLKTKRSVRKHLCLSVLQRLVDCVPSEVVVRLFLWRNVDRLQHLAVHEVVAQGFGSHFSDLGVLELDKCIALAAAGLLASRETQASDGTELAEIFLQLFLEETMRQIVNEHHAALQFDRVKTMLILLLLNNFGAIQLE